MHRVALSLGISLVLTATVLSGPRPDLATAVPTTSASPAINSPALERGAPDPDAPDGLPYRDPVRYRGPAAAPRVRPLVAEPTVLSATGEHPDVYVDEAGTAHLVWNEGRGDGADETVYCRLPRLVTTCETTTALRWDKTYATGDDPSANTDYDGPRIVRIGDTLLALSFRYPTIGIKPDGASSNTLVGWVSNDGGTTWDDAAILGKRRLGELAVTGPDNDPLVLSLGQDPFCFDPETPGSMCATAIRSGVYETATGVLSPRSGADYHPTLALDDGTVVAGMSDAGVGAGTDPWSIWLRRWSGVEPITDPDNWSLTDPIPGDEPDLAGGPRGLYLLAAGWRADPGVTGDLQLRRVRIAGDGSVALARPARIAGDRSRLGQVTQDPGGGLHVAYVDEDGIWLRSTMPEADPSVVPALLPAVRLSTGDPTSVGGAVRALALSAAADGGGFAAHSALDGGVAVTGFGSTAPTGAMGIAGRPGGGNVDCERVRFGAFAIETVQACLFRGTGANANVVVTRGAVTLNGLEIVPTQGSTLIIDSEKLTIDTIGEASVFARNGDAEIELYRGPLHKNLAGLRPGDRLFEFSPEHFAAEILGFPVASGLPVELTDGGVRIPFEVGLPAEFAGFTGSGVLRLEKDVGLILDSLDFRFGPVAFGAVGFGGRLRWQQGGTWTGEGMLGLPVGGSIEASIGFVEGDFDEASLGYTPNPPVPIGKFVYLTYVGGRFDIRPDTLVEATATIGAGLPVRGAQPVTANGRMTFVFPDDGPGRFELGGTVQLLGIGLSESLFRFVTDGYATYRGSSELELGPISGGVTVEGFIDGRNGDFGARATAGGTACGIFTDAQGNPEPAQRCSTGGIQLAVSSIGFAACAGVETPLGDATIGVELPWADVEPAALLNPLTLSAQIALAIEIPCSTDAFIVPPPLAAPALVAGDSAADRAERRRVAAVLAAGGTAFRLDGGLPTATVRITPEAGGAADPTDVVVTAPDGTQIRGPEAQPGASTTLTIPDTGQQFVVIPEPMPGAWTVEPTADVDPDVDLGQVAVSRGYQLGTVRATGTPSLDRGKVAVDYRAAGLGAGQSVTFRETGRFGTREISTVAAPAGRRTLIFSPAPGPGGKRRIEAVIAFDGIEQQIVGMGSYTAPAPKRPGRVRQVSVTAKGSRVRVALRAPRGVDLVVVAVRGDAGSAVTRSVLPSVRALTLDGWRWDRRITVRVHAVRDGRSGPTTTARTR